MPTHPQIACKEDASDVDEDQTPSLSAALDMPQFSGLEIVDSEESVQEVFKEGDW